MTTPHEKLAEALRSVDWASNVEEFLKEEALTEAIAKCHLRLARWAKQIESADAGNAALAFVREMQVSGSSVAALMALSLYKPAAASIRAMFEAALYYTYFCNHPVELATLVRVARFHISKQDILDYHLQHTRDFKCRQNLFGLSGRITEWYSHISAIAHGQLPGEWVEHRALSEITPSKKLLEEVARCFMQAEEIIHHLFLCSIAQDLWNDFAPEAKEALLAGIQGDIKAKLGLDAC